MTKLVKEFVQIKDYTSLDRLIETLQSIRAALPADSQEAEVRLRGDDIFGRHLAISYLRPQTAEEAACHARYADAYEASRQQQLANLQAELDAQAAARGTELHLAA